LAGWHDGYTRLSGKPRHHRQFALHASGTLMIRDEIESQSPVTACARLHLHPDCLIREANAGRVSVSHPACDFVVVSCGDSELTVEDSTYCPEFGKAVANKVLVFTDRGTKIVMRCAIAWRGETVVSKSADHLSVDGRRYDW
jgi:uncharacterized heparinase superfamily protein